MLARFLFTAIIVLTPVGSGFGQQPITDTKAGSQRAWEATAGASQVTAQPPSEAESSGATLPDVSAQSQQPVTPVQPQPRTPVAEVTAGDGELPNEHGQLWRYYDISPYTLRVTATNRPEQAIIDWIFRETGYEVWHGEVLSILSPKPRTLRVYHTPEMQQVVADIVDRFVSTEAETHAFGLRVVSLSHPNWRSRAQRLLRPVQVQTPGVQAWIMQKEDAAILMAELRRRSDYREHSSPHLLVNNGQSTVVSATRGRSYVRSAVLRADTWPGFEPDTAMLDEGFSLEFSPLLSLDGRLIDAAIKCEIDQVEKMVPVTLDVPTSVSARQRTKIEVPQMSHFRFHERFRWPVDQVLLVGMGMVALPVPSEGQSLVPGLPLPLPSSPARADVLVFVESKGKIAQSPNVSNAGRPDAQRYRGRY